MQIDGSGALVAGGASGLGEAAARRLHVGGAHVMIADRDEARGLALVEEFGERAGFALTDVTDPHAVQAAVDKATELPVPLRIAVSCAGIGGAGRVVGSKGPHSLERFETVIRVNLIGTFNVMRLAATAMAENEPTATSGRGVCVNTASIAAFDGQIGQIAYSASKGAIVSMTLPAARDLAPSGIRVCAIAPGVFETPLLGNLPQDAIGALGEVLQFPHRFGRPDEFAALVAHIVENEMLNGEVIRLDGALRMPPK
jgi:3-hydroxyacyl-CoA dehydrogenase / 3-hydroxy-2-methylbutyryl-CoA dehydrogenase